MRRENRPSRTAARAATHNGPRSWGAAGLLTIALVAALTVGTASPAFADPPSVSDGGRQTSSAETGPNHISALARDCGISTRLLNGTYFWVFCDSGFTSSTGDSLIVSNSAAFAASSTPQAMNDWLAPVTGHGYELNGGYPFIPNWASSCDGSSSNQAKAWPRSMVNVGTTTDRILIWYSQVCDHLTGAAGYTFHGTGVAEYTPVANTDYAYAAAPAPPVAPAALRNIAVVPGTTGSNHINLFGDSYGTTGYQQGGFYWTAYNYVYLYSCVTGTGCKVARVTPNGTKEFDKSQYEYSTGSSWGAEGSAATLTNLGSGDVLPMNMMSTQLDPQTNQWMMVYTACVTAYGVTCPSANQLVVRTADAAVGAWSSPTYYALPTTGTDACAGPNCYAALGHADITSSGSVTVTYADVGTHLHGATMPFAPANLRPEGVLNAPDAYSANPVHIRGFAADPNGAFTVGVTRDLSAITPSSISIVGTSLDITLPSMSIGSHLLCVTLTDTATTKATPLPCQTYNVAAAPSAPTVSAGAWSPASGSIALTWTPGSANGAAITSYQVSSGATVVFGPKTPAQLGCTTTCTATVTGLTNGSTQQLTVAAQNAIGWGASSTATLPVLVQAPGQLHPVNPTRILTANLTANTVTPLNVGAALTTIQGSAITPSSVSINVTASAGAAFGKVTSYPQGSPQPGTSTVVYNAGQTTAASATVGVGTSTSISLVATTNVTVNVDITAYADTNGAPNGGNFTSLTPVVLPGANSALVGGANPITLDVPVANLGVGFPAWTAKAVALNVSVVGGASPSTVAVYPKGSSATTATTVSFDANQAISNATIVGVGTSYSVTVAVPAGKSATVTISVSGYYDGTAGKPTFHPIVPARVFDTRSGSAIAVGSTRTFALPANTAGLPPDPATGTVGIAFSIMTTGATNKGAIDVFPGSTDTGVRTMSFVSTASTEDSANLAVVSGVLGVTNPSSSLSSVHVVIDVLGYYAV